LITAFFNISGGEIFIIILVIYIVFGPGKIPEIARWLGKGINEVKRATSEIRDEIDRETGDIRNATGRIKDDFTREFTEVRKATEKAAPDLKPDHAVEMSGDETPDDPYKLNETDDEDTVDKEK
jgi:sec-independent protein translocase protein TatA